MDGNFDTETEQLLLHSLIETLFVFKLYELYRLVDLPDGPGTPSVLWNAMIYPFLNMTIKGAIWYQGESNADKCLCSAWWS